MSTAGCLSTHFLPLVPHTNIPQVGNTFPERYTRNANLKNFKIGLDIFIMITEQKIPPKTPIDAFG